MKKCLFLAKTFLKTHPEFLSAPETLLKGKKENPSQENSNKIIKLVIK